MSSEVRPTLLGNLLEITSSKRIHMADYVASGIPFYRSKEVIERAKGNNISTELFISHAQFELIKQKFGSPRDGDILLTSVGTLGVPYVVRGDGDFYFKDGNLTWMRNFSEMLSPQFLYFWLTSPQIQQKLDQVSIGSTQKALTISALKALEIPLPPRATQDEIVEVLAALSDRITLARETNATLEAIAQALFKSWFVDFDPVHAKMEGRVPEGMDEATATLFSDALVESELGLVPRGWQTMPIGEAVDAVGGATPDTKTPSFWEPAIHCWTTPKDLSGMAAPVLLDTERKLSDQGLAKIGSGALPVGTLLLSSRAPIGYLAISQVPLAINQGYIAMPPGGLLPPLYLLFWCRQNMENIKGRANGSTFMEISKKAFRPIPALVPPAEVLRAFVDIAGALFDRLIENEKQAQTLVATRDSLLPKLISGKLVLSQESSVAS